MVVVGSKTLKELVGLVKSDKMNKTVVVTVNSVKTHPLYKKRYVVKKNYYAHNEMPDITIGTKVRIRQHRPMSKLKRWIVVGTEK